MRCPNCSREFTPNTVRQMYCDIRCTDAAAHKRSRKKAKLGRLNQAYRDAHTQQQSLEQLEEQRLRKIHQERMLEEEAAALHDIFGYKPKHPANLTVPDTGISEDEAKSGKMTLDDI